MLTSSLRCDVDRRFLLPVFVFSRNELRPLSLPKLSDWLGACAFEELLKLLHVRLAVQRLDLATRFGK